MKHNCRCSFYYTIIYVCTCLSCLEQQLKDSSVIISALASTLRNPKESIVDILESYPSYYDEDNKLQFSNRFNVMYGNDSARLQKNQYEKM